MQRDREYLTSLETLDNGKSLAESDFDIGMAIDCMKYYAGWPDKIHGENIPCKKVFFICFPYLFIAVQ